MTGLMHANDEPFIVDLSQFQGPLDLLLGLIRDAKVDIYDIPISRIADQFLARISTLGLDQAADYLEMAARLLRIKSQMLLPRKDSDEPWEDPRAELVRRLLEYQQMREIVDHLERRGIRTQPDPAADYRIVVLNVARLQHAGRDAAWPLLAALWRGLPGSQQP